MDGKLFSQDFLKYGITDTPVWKAIDDENFLQFKQSLTQIFQLITVSSVMNEANTESEIIDKILAQLDWQNLSLKQVTATQKRRDDVPDYLLFSSVENKSKAQAESKEDRRYRHGISIVEAKKWLRPLDRGDETNKLDPSTPSNQILRYLSSVEIASERAISFGILTNGALWRLYWQGARSRSEEYLEIDLAAALQVKGVEQSLFAVNADHVLKVFYCTFNRSAFKPQNWDTARRTFHAFALKEARLYEERVSEDLGTKVFEIIFPQIANALASSDEKANLNDAQYLDELREATLIFLYRLLFIFYAEDRNLLPVTDNRYDDYALRTIREEIAKRRDANDAISNTASKYWQHLNDLFRIISKGDASIGMPAYNGGLFEEVRAPILSRARMTDAIFAPLLDDLSRSLLGKQSDLFRSYINYRDLSVQHLGGIYERLLEYSLVVENKKILARPASFARKTSGSYYTHDGLVQFVIKEAVGPQIAECLTQFKAQIVEWENKKELSQDHWKTLERLDPASAILELKICDPAMGSGHFLVTLVDYLADQILEIMVQTEQLVAAQAWAQEIANPYISPLISRIKDIRNRILTTAHKARWAVTESQLDDKHIVRRMILKRVVYGVDKNPMAVELAKVALWLHTFTVGAPLSFLDHHLRCGDSLFGGRVKHITDELAKLGGMFYQDDMRRLNSARSLMDAIGNLTDIDITEAHHSKAMMDEAELGLAPLKRTLDFLQAKRWATKAQSKNYEATWAGILAQEYGDNLIDSVGFLSKKTIKLPLGRQKDAHTNLQHALVKADTEHFLHWELAFPTVWQNGLGGFDAIIGNPPWDRIKLQQVEWFAERKPAIAKSSKAADRKAMIDALAATNDSLWQQYAAAAENAEIASKVARTCGDYPLLSGGDINLYSLFVERANSLVKPTGMVGLITPSGIAADLGASDFFRTLSETGRLNSLFDFENKKVFFPDVHASFKFCALSFGGVNRQFAYSRCAFYLHQLEELENAERILKLTAQDFAAVNPNTGAAPIFKSKRDAEIATAIYARQPVLVDKRDPKNIQKVWPVKYLRMFDMTNDSQLFMRQNELEKQGWYSVGANRWKKAEAEAVPLYEGKMVQMYDHRAANVVLNLANLKRPAQQEAVLESEHQNASFVPSPQFWVNSTEVNQQFIGEWSIAYKSITSPTNMRTMIPAIIPKSGVGNSMALLLPDNEATSYQEFAPQLLANMASFAFDYSLRQKVQGQNLNWFMIEQLPLIKPAQFEHTLGNTKIADYVRAEVLHLSYTAHDLAPFARDMGYVDVTGNVKPPFMWDATDRLHRQCRLDALFFNLYDINRDDAAYILDQFPIVEKQDRGLHNRYLTKELILGYMNAVKVGDFVTVIKL